ncbi:MAG: hypothetical protein GX159_11730 [Flavobacteriaceae bacterium]|jgi:hypothetical protein|nr:hypothetical protein [Flavobacteriaceae bacterium]
MKLYLTYTIVMLTLFFAAFTFAQEDNYQEIGLTEEEILYLNENLDVKKGIDEYLEQSNPLTNENKKFVKDLVALLCEMDYKMPVYTKDDYPGKEEGWPFEWWKNSTWLDNNFSLDPYHEYKDLTKEEK